MMSRTFFWIVLAAGAVLASSIPDNPPEKPVKVGIVLSAGGALGLAHIGVLKVLEEEGIPVACISANSMGSIIGGLYAAGYSAAQIESVMINLDWTSILTPGLASGAYNRLEYRCRQRYLLNLEHHNFVPSIPRGLISLQKVEHLLRQFLAGIEYDADYDFDRLPIPLRVIAVDLNTGSKVILGKGSMVKAIRGSIAIPGVFPSEVTANKNLVDGGVLQYLPVDPIRDFAPDLVIAVLTVKRGEPIGTSLIDVMSRTTSMIGMEDIEVQKKHADIVIEPDLARFAATDYVRIRDLIAAGAAAARAALPQIRERLADRTLDHVRPARPQRPRPAVRKIDVEGVNLIRAADFIGNVRTKTGIPLDFNLLNRDLARIYDSGFFQEVGYRLEASGRDTVDLVFETKEKEFGFYLLGMRYDNYDNVTLGLELGQERINRNGWGVRGVINLGEPNEYRLSLTHIDPFVLPFSSHITAYWSSIDRSYYADREWMADYNVDVRGGTLGLTNHVGGNAFVDLEFPVQQSIYRYPAESLFNFLPRQEWTAGPSLKIEIDNQDDPFLPGRGLSVVLRADYGLPGIGDAGCFTRIELLVSQYIPLSPWAAVFYNVDLGGSWGDLPWSGSFYTGGDNFAGYKPETYTSRNKTQAGIGLAFHLSRLGSRKDDNLMLRLEADFAGFRRGDRLTGGAVDPLGHEFHIGAGPALIIKTPLGPLQFKIGWANLYPQYNHKFPRSWPTALFISLGKDFRYTK